MKIHADWCGTCKAIAPVWEELRGEVAGRATLVTFDVTDRSSYEAAKAHAEKLGLRDFLWEYRRQTGTVGVISCDTLETVSVLRAERDLARYLAAIEEARERP